MYNFVRNFNKKKRNQKGLNKLLTKQYKDVSAFR